MRATLLLILVACGSSKSSAIDEPSKLVSAAQHLFQQGFADPREGVYREIEIATGSVWGGEENIKTRGWVLPCDDGATIRAVTWSGIVYPVVSAGAVADLRADVAALVEGERKAFATAKVERPDSSYHRFHTTSEDYNVSHESPTIVKVALLLRLDERALAEQLWEAIKLDESIDREDPYLLVAVDWAWNLFERAVTSHMRGADETALESARLLAAAAPKIEAEANRRKARTSDYDHVSFVKQLPALVADAERRVKRAPREKLEQKRLAALSPAGRTKLLIEHLDEVAARQDGQPGGVDLAGDPIVSALIDIGEPAVEPLIDVLETDVRLTRSVQFGRDFHRHRSLLGVHEAAYVALAGILEQRFFGAASTGDNLSARGTDGRRLVAAGVRAYWKKWKAVPLEERWFNVLADDAASPEEWIDAADKISRPNNVSVRPSSNAFVTTVTTSDGARGLRGEKLRARVRPSVTELLIKRLGDARVDVSAGCALAEVLGRWDKASAGPPASAHLTRAIAATKQSLEHGRCIADLTTDLAKAGDLGAVDRYAAWIAATTPPDSFFDERVLDPMSAHAARPSIAKAGDTLFRDGSPWVPLVERADLLETKLFRVAGFNKHVARALVDTRTVGTLEMQERGRFDVEMVGGGSRGTTTDEPNPPPPKTKNIVRVSDFYAWQLASHHKTAPRFEPFWPVKQRDAALIEMRAWVSMQLAK